MQREAEQSVNFVTCHDGFSRLRAMAFSAVWSTLWTLGPASESSLGNVQLHASPGVIDLTVTPTLGLGWAIGEDAIAT